MLPCRNFIKQMLVIVGLLLMYGLDYSLGQDPIIETKLGKIKGNVISVNGKQIYAYLGVPYATPPLGKLRFKRPKPVQPWNNVIDATNYPPACPQLSAYPLPWYDNISRYNESCLTLNILVPSSPRKDRAVLYWIFSGGFTFGSNSLPVYHAQALAAAGDIIVVNVNYRLGALGFLYSGTKEAPGNVGLYDSLLGLKWVNENIEAFGGDKNKITISGHSAGAITSSLFMVSPKAKGLFSRAILQSGNVANSFILDSAEANLDLGQKLAKKVGCGNPLTSLRTTPDIVVNCLRGVDAFELTKALNELKPRETQTFGIVKNDKILGDDPIGRLMSGDFYATDILTGVVPEELAFQITSAHVEEFGFYGRKSDYINKTYAKKLLKNEAFGKSKSTDKMTNYYLSGVDDSDIATIRKQTIDAFSDFHLICPSIYFSEQVSKKNRNVFFYVFTKRPSNTKWAPWMGVVHFDELQFTFGQPIINNGQYPQDEYDLSVELVQMWTNFVNYGRPDNDWPVFNAQNHITKILGKAYMKSYQEVLHLRNCNFLKPYILKP